MCRKKFIKEGASQESVGNRINLLRKAANVISSITVEPTLFLTMFASSMYQLVVQNLYLEKACRVELGYNESVCDAMTARNNSGYTQYQETEVQKMVSQMVGLRTLIQGCFPAVLVIFAGSWSDRHNRRKPLILIPIAGEIICCVLLIVNTIFFYELPLIFTTLGDSIPFALLGGWSCLNNGVFSYVGSKYKDEEKTMRVGIATASFMSGSLLGSSVCGFLYIMVGFIPFFSICIILFAIAFLFGYYVLRDEEIKPVKNIGMIQDLFSVEHFVNTLKTGFKSGPNKRRSKICCIMLALLLVGGPFVGELYMNYLYTRLKFSWDVTQFGVFTSTQLLLQNIGCFLSVVLFSRILHWDDTLLGGISLIGSCISNLFFAFAPSGIYLYIGVCCDVFVMTSPIAIRSLMLKIVQPNEMSQTSSVISLLEASVPMIYGPLYTTIYKRTIDIFPGTYFLVSLIIRIFGLSIFIWLFKEAMRERKHLESEGVDNMKDNQNISL